MSVSPYDRDLDRNAANFQPLTPLTFLERAAAVFPDPIAVAHGRLRRNYREFHARSKKLASALAKRGFVRGDTVAVMLANTPAMLECHYGAPMCRAVLNTLNTRLDAALKLAKARPEDKWGETPCAFVEMKPGHSATAEELIEWRRTRLARYKCPQHVAFAEIPKTSTGKVQKFALRERAKALGEKKGVIAPMPPEA